MRPNTELSRAMMSGGVPFGASTAHHTTERNPGRPASSIVGTSGSAAQRRRAAAGAGRPAGRRGGAASARGASGGAGPVVRGEGVRGRTALAKAHRGQLHFGSGGRGIPSHIAGETFKVVTGVDIVHVQL